MLEGWWCHNRLNQNRDNPKNGNRFLQVIKVKVTLEYDHL